MKKALICLLLFLTVGFSQRPITPATLPYYIGELHLNRVHIDSILAADSTSIYIEGIGIVDTSLIAYLNQDETITGNWVNTTSPWATNEIVDSYVRNAGDTMEGILNMNYQGLTKIYEIQ